MKRYYDVIVISGYGSSYLEYAGTNKWWLKEVKGARAFDKFVLSLLKSIYIGTRFLLRLILGRKKRDGLFLKRNINFKDFLYSSTKIMGVDKKLLLEIHVPNHDYRIHCPLNKEDFIVMTKHEEAIIGLFRPKEGDTVVDVGAHIGKYTIVASKMVGSKGKVIAIEAHPANYDVLKKNIALNKLNNVIALNFAVHSKEGMVKLYEPGQEEGFTIYNTIMTDRKTSNKQNYVEVHAKTLDSIFLENAIKEVNWIKIDVEGAEFDVLSGARNILSNSKDLSILIEIHNLGVKHRNLYEPIIELLELNRFRISFEKVYQSGERHIIVKNFSVGNDDINSAHIASNA